MKIVDTIMERYRDEKISIEKFELNGVCPFEKWIDIAFQNGAKELVIGGYYDISLPIFTIMASKSLRELVLKSSFV